MAGDLIRESSSGLGTTWLKEVAQRKLGSEKTRLREEVPQRRGSSEKK
jgi:hypothetical protein